MAIKELTAETFPSETTSGLVLVDFHAAWCGPCKMQGPVLETLAPAYEGRVRFVKADVDQLREAAIQYGVRSVPTLVLLRDGQPVEPLVGYQTATALQRALDAALA